MKYIIQFILGGGIIVGMSFLGSAVHPKFAALLYVLPIQFTVAAILIYLQKNEETVHQLAQNSLIYTLGLIGFLTTFYFLTKSVNFWFSLALSYALFILVSIVIFRLQ